jgi:ABC-type lipoprotein release transport system permease subunit
MRTLLRLAWRSLWRHRRRTIVTIGSIGLGLAFVVFFVCLAEGTYHQLVTDAVRMQAGHVTIEHAGYGDAPEVGLRVPGATRLQAALAALPGVASTKLVVLGQGLARSGADAVGVGVMGVEPAVEAATSPLARHMVAGAYLGPTDGARIVVGSLLAERLDLDVGKKVVISTNDASGALVEALFRVRGIFHTGAEEVDGYVTQVPLGAARSLFGLGADEVTQIGLVLRNPDDQAAVLAAARRLVRSPDLAVRPWQEVLPELAAFIRLDRTSDWTFQGLLIVIVFFTIFNTLLMSVLERRREFAVLLAIGTTPRQVAGQILLESLLLAVLGVATGLAIGGAAAGWVQVRGLDLTLFLEKGMTVSGFALSSRLHARVTLRVLGTLGGLVLGSTLLLALAPMRRAARIDVAEELR